MARRLKISPRKLPPLGESPSKSSSRAAAPKSPKSVQHRKEKNSAHQSFKDALPKDVRCLVYQQLNYSDLKKLENHSLFREISECVREIIVDEVADPDFVAKFTKLQRLTGSYHIVAGVTYQDFGVLHQNRYTIKVERKVSGVKKSEKYPREENDERWIPILQKGVLLDHILIHLDKKSPRDSLDLPITEQIFAHPPYNFAYGTMNEPDITGGIFEGGIMTGWTGLEVYTPAQVAAIKASGITRLWLTDYIVLKLGSPHAVPGVIAIHNESIDDFIDKCAVLGLTEVGVSHYTLGRAYSAERPFDLATLKKNYAGKLPLVIQE